jgi:O-antigen/teichoic acid export membrane protein
LALGITLLVAMGISMSKTKAFKYKWDVAVIKKMLLMSYPFAIIGILMTLYYRLDGVMIEQMLLDGKEQAGIYAASYRLFDASNMIAYLFATLLLPMFSNMIFKKESVEELTKTATYLLFAASALVAILSIFFGDQLMPLLYQQASDEWIIIFQLLMVSFVAVSMTYVYGTLLTAGGHLKLFNILAFLGLMINFGLNLFLIPTYKALGATWATFVTQFFIAILQIIFVMIKYKVRFSLGEISKLSIYTLTTITLTFLCAHYKIKLFASISMISSAAVILFFALKFIPLNSFSRLIKRES